MGHSLFLQSQHFENRYSKRISNVTEMHSNIKLRYKCDYALGTFSRVGLYIKLSYFVEFVKVMRFVLKQCQLKDKILFLPKSCLPFDRHTLNTFTFCDACPQSGSRTIQDCMNFYKHDFKRIFALFIWQKHPQLNFTFFFSRTQMWSIWTIPLSLRWTMYFYSVFMWWSPRLFGWIWWGCKTLYCRYHSCNHEVSKSVFYP